MKPDQGYGRDRKTSTSPYSFGHTRIRSDGSQRLKGPSIKHDLSRNTALYGIVGDVRRNLFRWRLIMELAEAAEFQPPKSQTVSTGLSLTAETGLSGGVTTIVVCAGSVSARIRFAAVIASPASSRGCDAGRVSRVSRGR